MVRQKSIIKKGKDIFYRIKPLLIKKYKSDSFVAIETTSGKFFMGKSPLEAINKAKKKFPRKQFFLTQTGRAAGILK